MNRICGLVQNEWERQRAVKDDSQVLSLMARKPESHGLRQKEPEARAQAGWKGGWEFGEDLGDARLHVTFRLGGGRTE